MSTSAPTPREALEQLDARQEELIRRLDELNAHIEAALAEFVARRDANGPKTLPRPADLRKAA
jgi:hypothetical protein